MSSSSTPPTYASEQDLPTTSHDSVFQPAYDNTSSTQPTECANCNHPLPSAQSSSSQSNVDFPSSSGSIASSLSTDNLSQSSTKGESSSSSSSVAGGEQKKKASKPLIETLLKKNAQWRSVRPPSLPLAISRSVSSQSPGVKL